MSAEDLDRTKTGSGLAEVIYLPGVQARLHPDVQVGVEASVKAGAQSRSAPLSNPAVSTIGLVPEPTQDFAASIARSIASNDLPEKPTKGLAESSIEKLTEDSAAQEKIRERSLRILARSDLNHKELVERLSEFDPDLVRLEISELERLGYLDDDRAARELVRRLVERKVLGLAGIRAELHRRGFLSATIEAVLFEYDQADEFQRALDYVSKKADRDSRTDRETLIRRLSGQLARRGFSAEIIRRAILDGLNNA